MSKDVVIYGRHSCQADWFSLAFKVTTPTADTLDGEKIVLFLHWEWPLSDLRSQIWYVQPGGHITITTEATRTENIIKITIEFHSNTIPVWYDHALGRYFVELSFGIHQRNFARVNKLDSPSLRAQNPDGSLGTPIPCADGGYVLFPYVNWEDPDKPIDPPVQPTNKRRVFIIIT